MAAWDRDRDHLWPFGRERLPSRAARSSSQPIIVPLLRAWLRSHAGVRVDVGPQRSVAVSFRIAALDEPAARAPLASWQRAELQLLDEQPGKQARDNLLLPPGALAPFAQAALFSVRCLQRRDSTQEARLELRVLMSNENIQAALRDTKDVSMTAAAALAQPVAAAAAPPRAVAAAPASAARAAAAPASAPTAVAAPWETADDVFERAAASPDELGARQEAGDEMTEDGLSPWCKVVRGGGGGGGGKGRAEAAEEEEEDDEAAAAGREQERLAAAAAAATTVPASGLGSRLAAEEQRRQKQKEQQQKQKEQRQ
jgi:hypothetical protein